ncbi:hypothetical protein EAS54_05845 [Bradyrhizobium guangzhouense]|nr:hypothetical protein EAS54_05845 [Bradyrhizobium guangzhouense]
MALCKLTHRSHSPRRRGIQYAAASRLNHCCLGVLDRPVPAPPRLRRGLHQRSARRSFSEGGKPGDDSGA